MRSGEVEEKLLTAMGESPVAVCSGGGYGKGVDDQGAFATVDDCRDLGSTNHRRAQDILIPQAASFPPASPAPSTSRSPPNAYQRRGRFVVWPVYLDDGSTSCPPPLGSDN